MSKKYELTDETIEYKSHVLHRIRALRDFSDVKNGDLGGFIESEKNLSQTKNCWIYDNAKIIGRSRVMDNSIICNNAIIDCRITVAGSAKVSGNVKVSGWGFITDNATISGNANIHGRVELASSAMVTGNAKISGGITMSCSAMVSGNAVIATINCPLIIGSNTHIANNAYITSNKDHIYVSMFWADEFGVTFYKTRNGEIWVSDKKYNGSISELRKLIKECDEKESDKKNYLMIVDFAEKYLK